MYLLEFFNVKETTKDLIVFNVFLPGCMKLALETSVMPVSCLWKDGRNCQQDQKKTGIMLVIFLNYNSVIFEVTLVSPLI